ncbi:MAG TPA: PemK family transcriptional regulator, partial [Lachnospiraceae bacterium]|nr:PemK family transcriptional regulator [Lachnospiraceae bacterium]
MIQRGDIFLADLDPVTGSEQGGIRPIVVVQNDTGNRNSPTVIAAAVTSNVDKTPVPTHVELIVPQLPKDSMVLLEQIRTLDKSRLMHRIGRVSPVQLMEIDEGLYISFGLLREDAVNPLDGT